MISNLRPAWLKQILTRSFLRPVVLLAPASEFNNGVRTKETTKIKVLGVFPFPEYKLYAPGIGLVQGEKLELTQYGYVERMGNK